MKRLYESLLDDDDKLFNDTSKEIIGEEIKKQIDEFILTYYNIKQHHKSGPGSKGSYEILKDVKGKFVVKVIGDIEFELYKNPKPEKLTNGLFRFGTIYGDFNCSYNSNLKTLEGGPEEVNGYFSCGHCMNLKTLEGAPKKVKEYFNCEHCINLKTLKGVPKRVGGSFYCNDCPKLISLEGAPKYIKSAFDCNNCINLVSIKGAPEKIKDDFNCSDCPKLTSLEGLPKEIGANLYCINCGRKFNLEDVKGTYVKYDIYF